MQKERDAFSGINLRDIEIFIVLADTRNTTSAATRLGISQSAVSQSVARLERWLGVSLLDRSCRPIQVTHGGEIFKIRAEEILKAVVQTAEDVRAGANGAVPLLRLGLIDTFAMNAGHDIVKALTDQVEMLQVWSGITPTLKSELLSRAVDVVVCNDAMAEHTELQRHCLFREPFLAVVPKSQAERLRTLTLPQLCEALPLVRFSSRSHVGQSVEYYLSQRKLSPGRSMEFDASEAVMRMVAGGVGWAIATPMCVLQAHNQKLDFVTLPLPAPQAYRQVYLVWRKGELAQIIPIIIAVCTKSIDKLILPAARELAPWVQGSWSSE